MRLIIALSLFTIAAQAANPPPLKYNFATTNTSSDLTNIVSALAGTPPNLGSAAYSNANAFATPGAVEAATNIAAIKVATTNIVGGSSGNVITYYNTNGQPVITITQPGVTHANLGGGTNLPRAGVVGLETALDYLTNNIGNGAGGSATNLWDSEIHTNTTTTEALALRTINVASNEMVAIEVLLSGGYGTNRHSERYVFTVFRNEGEAPTITGTNDVDRIPFAVRADHARTATNLATILGLPNNSGRSLDINTNGVVEINGDATFSGSNHIAGALGFEVNNWSPGEEDLFSVGNGGFGLGCMKVWVQSISPPSVGYKLVTYKENVGLFDAFHFSHDGSLVIGGTYSGLGTGITNEVGARPAFVGTPEVGPAFTNIIAARFPVLTNAGVIYYLTLSTNAP